MKGQIVARKCVYRASWHVVRHVPASLDVIITSAMINQEAAGCPPEKSRPVIEAFCDMEEMSVESVFGTITGIVWEALNKHCPSKIDNLVKVKGLRRELFYGALGWLVRENNISVERRGRAMVFSLRP